jgi:hypothetical protein
MGEWCCASIEQMRSVVFHSETHEVSFVLPGVLGGGAAWAVAGGWRRIHGTQT